ncbi:hypothetical protein BC332_24858 [Capsicum chinense]|nr:hypothetical protein BC332_24858 [Capsicum chinense]
MIPSTFSADPPSMASISTFSLPSSAVGDGDFNYGIAWYGADATRAKQVEEYLRKIEAQVQANKVEVDSKLSAIESRLPEIGSAQGDMKQIMEETHEAMMRLLGKSTGKSPFTPESSNRGDGLLPTPNRAVEVGEMDPI